MTKAKKNILVAMGGIHAELSADDLRAGMRQALEQLSPRSRVLLLPPDITRMHSRAGILTCAAWDFYGNRVTDILPATGTHEPMTPREIATMFPGVPPSLFRVHNWREDVTTLGTVPGSYISELTQGRLDFDWDAQINHLLADGGHDLIISPGQVVPHEVVGMANHNKNVLVGVGGYDNIHKTHYVGAVCGMEGMMGRSNTPVRALLNRAMRDFGAHLPLLYALTVVGRNAAGALVTRGLFIGEGNDCFDMAAALAQQANIHLLDHAPRRVVVYLDPEEYRSTWLGNKSLYRTRMAIADDGELIVMAPGLRTFGEDREIDTLIRKYGYRTTPDTLAAVRDNRDIADNLAAAAHLIHGSTEGRFNVTYCPGQLTRTEIESVGYRFGDLAAMQRRYPINTLKDGVNTLPNGEEIFYVSNPALGLWADRKRFEA